MRFPKFVLASNGKYTGLLLDGVFFGEGIKRLEFSTENKDGQMKSTINIMELDVSHVSLTRGSDDFETFLAATAGQVPIKKND